MQVLLLDFIKNPNEVEDIREKSNFHFKKGYLKYWSLHQGLLNGETTIENLNEVKIFFLNNQILIDDLRINNKYLEKYVNLVHKFWNSYSFYTGNIVTVSKFNLFDEIEKELFSTNPKFGYILQHSAVMRRSLEEAWIASNQVLTKYEISLLSH